jgi:branched-chain amino acid transport system ATP-binding protein
MSEPILKVSELTKSYGAIQAVRSVSFEVPAGEIFGVIGPNGSGKTTLFNSMLGQITPDSGRIVLKGEDVTHLGPLELNRKGVGRTFQTLQVFPKMSVMDNLLVAAQEHEGNKWSRLWSVHSHTIEERANHLIDQFRIRHVAHQRAGELSYGQQKLVDIAMAFMREPDVVLLDEPCAGVNPTLVGEIGRLLRALNEEKGGSFVVIEHNMDFVMSLCHRVMVMVEGEILAIGTPDEIRANDAVLNAYLGN